MDLAERYLISTQRKWRRRHESRHRHADGKTTGVGICNLTSLLSSARTFVSASVGCSGDLTEAKHRREAKGTDWLPLRAVAMQGRPLEADPAARAFRS